MVIPIGYVLSGILSGELGTKEAWFVAPRGYRMGQSETHDDNRSQRNLRRCAQKKQRAMPNEAYAVADGDGPCPLSALINCSLHVHESWSLTTLSTPSPMLPVVSGTFRLPFCSSFGPHWLYLPPGGWSGPYGCESVIFHTGNAGKEDARALPM